MREKNFIVKKRWSFSGYFRGEWIEKSWFWANFAGLLDFSLPDISFEIEKLENTCFKKIGLGTIFVQPGIFSELVSLGNLIELKFPEKIEEIPKEENNLLVICTKDSNIYKFLKPDKKSVLEYDNEIHISYFENKKIFVLASSSKENALKLYSLVKNTIDLLKKYKIVKGWPFYNTNYYMISQRVENPIVSLSKAINQGCSWMFLIGPYENLTVKELNKWIKNVGLDFVVTSGQVSNDGKVLMLDMEDYPSFQGCNYKVAYQWYKTHNGYLFVRFSAYDVLDDIPENSFDGYIFEKGNSQYLKEVDKPFLVFEHFFDFEKVPASMFVLIPKDTALNIETLMKSILGKKCIGVFPPNYLVGPEELLKFFSILFLEKDYLLRNFRKNILFETHIEGNQLKIEIINTTDSEIDGHLIIHAPNCISIEKSKIFMQLASRGKTSLRIPFKVIGTIEGNIAPIFLVFKNDKESYYDITYVSIPDIVSVPQMLFRYSNNIIIPVTIFNLSDKENIYVNLIVNKDDKTILDKNFNLLIKPGDISNIDLTLQLEPGEYDVSIKFLDKEAKCKLLVNEPKGNVIWYKSDYDKDGLEEIILENEKVRIIVLPWEGRIIRFSLKDRDQDVLFKIWPKRPLNWRDANRRSEYWPYGGLEEFINYPTVGCHVPFDLKILNASQNSVTVEASAVIHGNKIVKNITLFGDLPLVEVIYKIIAKNPELNVLGVNPLIRIGGSCDQNHIFIFPTEKGYEKRRYLKNRMYGEFFDLKEGWVAGYDEEENITLVTLFPPDVPYVTHLWMNTPLNRASHHYYVEIQPWVKIKENNPLYFSYYMYAESGFWKETVEKLRKINLIREKNKQ